VTRKLRNTGPTHEKLIDTSKKKHPRLDPKSVAAALGAEATGQKIEEVLAPITLFAVRSELASRLQSSGGRPALSGTSRRAKVPITNQVWQDLEELASLASGEGICPTAGQIASVLLTLSAQSVLSQIAGASRPGASPLVRDLAARSATKPK
jgi:hypothetical protein